MPTLLAACGECNGELPGRDGLNFRRRPANVLQHALAQQIRIARAGFCKLDDLVRYCLLDVVAAALDLQGDADQAEGDTEDAHALWVELFAVKVR
jgi:hypothetical protein